MGTKNQSLIALDFADGLIEPSAQAVFQQPAREPLSNSPALLRALQRALARRDAQAMAVALVKRCNAARVRCSARPAGLSGRPAHCVATSRRSLLRLRRCALSANRPESQKRRGVTQRLPSRRRRVCRWRRSGRSSAGTGRAASASRSGMPYRQYDLQAPCPNTGCRYCCSGCHRP